MYINLIVRAVGYVFAGQDRNIQVGFMKHRDAKYLQVMTVKLFSIEVVLGVRRLFN